MSEQRSAPELLSVSTAQWDEARRRLAVIAPLAQSPHRTRSQVIAASAELGFSPAHVYVLLSRYLADQRLTSLLSRPCGGVHGRSRLTGEIDALIDEVIETVYLTRQRPKIMDLVELGPEANLIKLRGIYRSANGSGITSRPSRSGGKAYLRRKVSSASHSPEQRAK